MKNNLKPEDFGTVLGISPGNIPVYSSNYDSITGHHKFFRNYIDGIFMGYKWQCVEFARRWLYLTKGFVFNDIIMAYDIFQLKSVRQQNKTLPLHSFENGCKRLPEPGAMLIWDDAGEFERTGHVAIIVEVFPDKIRVVEQNVENYLWDEGLNFSRELKAHIDREGGYWIECNFKQSKILGWVMQTDDKTHAKEFPEPDKKLLNLISRTVENHGQANQPLPDMDAPDEIAFNKITRHPSNPYRYFCMTKTAENEIRHATNELHAMFIHATDHVLQNEHLLEKFCIPKIIWPKIQDSWNNRRNEMITGRFDFSISELGIKVYEYNADSASSHMECGKIQDKWAKHFGCHDGRCAGSELFKRLVRAWQEVDVENVLHIMHDSDLEEIYHALYMKSAIEAAGIKCKTILGTEGISWNNQNKIVDADGTSIKYVWKTWAWETALDQIRSNPTLGDTTKNPRLADILFHNDIQIFEPLWTVITSNKALLPILSSLYPNHPFLPDASFTLTDELREKGYVVKPIVGRCGANIKIVKENESVIEETKGKFGDKDQIFQEFCLLPRIDNHSVQIGVFTVKGAYSGANIRMDPSPIVVFDSELAPLRIVD